MNAVFNFRELFIGEDFKTSQFTDTSTDHDRNIYEAILIQQMNKQEYKDFNRLLRLNDKDYGHCGHEWDCCGCCTGTGATIEPIASGVFKVKYEVCFNY